MILKQEVVGAVWLMVSDVSIFSVAKVHNDNIDRNLSEFFKVDLSLLVLLELLEGKLAPVDLTLDKVLLPAHDTLLVLPSLSQVQCLHGLRSLDVLYDPEIQLDLLRF